jgi:fucose permease
MQYGLVIASLGLYMTAKTQSLWVLLIASLIYGTGAGGLGLIQNIMVKQGASPHRRRQALAGLHSIYGLASLMAPLGVRALASVSFDWREILIIFAVIPIIMSIMLFRVRPVTSTEDTAKPQPVSLLFRYRQLKIGMVVGGAVTAELAISTRLVALLERSGYEPDAAALGLVAFFLCLLIGRLSCSVADNPLSNRTLLYLSASLSIVFFVLGLTISPLLLPLVALPLGPFVPVIFDLIANEFPDHFEGTLAFSMVVVSTMLVISHQLIGLFTDIWTMNNALFWGACTLLISIFLLPRTVDNTDESQPSAEE